MDTSFEHALVVVNPKAGKTNIRNGLFKILNVIASHGCISTVRITQAHGDAVSFVEDLQDRYDVVICCGGDGTLNEVITGMMSSGRKIPIGYIPCGSTNDTANTLGIPRNIEAAAELIFRGKASDFDIGSFNGEKFFSYITSFGAFTKVSYATPQSAKNAIGHMAYILEGAKSLGSIKPYHVKFEFGETTVEDDFLFGAISNSTSAGGVLKFPANAVDLNDGLFELLLIKNPKNPVELSNTVIALGTKTFDNPNILLYHTNKIRVTADSVLEWTVDGEFGGEHDRIEVENLKGAVQIIRPARQLFE
ncbi:MAG: diacylglycerol kinase family lipid kinase [Clostridia bacterium]|nr:diacylglycerol kinase family lipid kinase [Clostridia bacterium]